MEEIFLQTPPFTEAKKQVCEVNQKRLKRWIIALSVSMITGIITGLLGLVLGAISYLDVFKNEKTVNFAGNLMIIMAFPLMMFGAHALDKIKEIKTDRKKFLQSRNSQFLP